ncbi:tetratricopeptide repeat protein [Salinispora vitiensis]|uniref:tetratricopeptide repeat protein n=1 Tax=Salinispora vitiensis TaxID=999544 RepID=UPI0003AA0723|nr:tetratricopeptide repeat protein [Salinispora vitiensis]
MTISEVDWENRVATLWQKLDEHDPAEFRSKVEELAAERDPGDAKALFERACANDSTGLGERAAPLYRQALAAGLEGIRRRRAVIQLASTLRNLGHPEESVSMLSAEIEKGSDELDDAVAAFLALALTDVGREREAVSLALGALAKHLPRYNRSLAYYSKAVISSE